MCSVVEHRNKYGNLIDPIIIVEWSYVHGAPLAIISKNRVDIIYNVVELVKSQCFDN